MKRRKWDSKTKAMIAIQGLKGKPVSELCTEHRIIQAQYYQWRDQLLANASKSFEIHQESQKEQKLVSENEKLKALVGVYGLWCRC